MNDIENVAITFSYYVFLVAFFVCLFVFLGRLVEDELVEDSRG